MPKSRAKRKRVWPGGSQVSGYQPHTPAAYLRTGTRAAGQVRGTAELAAPDLDGAQEGAALRPTGQAACRQPAAWLQPGCSQQACREQGWCTKGRAAGGASQRRAAEGGQGCHEEAPAGGRGAGRGSPGRPGQQGQGHHHGHKHGRDAVRKGLDGRLAHLQGGDGGREQQAGVRRGGGAGEGRQPRERGAGAASRGRERGGGAGEGRHPKAGNRSKGGAPAGVARPPWRLRRQRPPAPPPPGAQSGPALCRRPRAPRARAAAPPR